MGGIDTCPLVDGAGSCGSGRQDLVKGCVYILLLAQDDFRQPDGWGCVPTLLVVCPEVTHYWNLQTIVWVSVPKRQPPGAFMPMFILRVSATSPCPHSEPFAAFPGDPPRPTGRSDPGSYGVTALPWVPVHVKT